MKKENAHRHRIELVNLRFVHVSGEFRIEIVVVQYRYPHCCVGGPGRRPTILKRRQSHCDQKLPRNIHVYISNLHR